AVRPVDAEVRDQDHDGHLHQIGKVVDRLRHRRRQDRPIDQSGPRHDDDDTDQHQPPVDEQEGHIGQQAAPEDLLGPRSEQSLEWHEDQNRQQKLVQSR
ncbi:hypothetical protein chiPu_0030317, partial [Chiloscyllium punctatum]|nr:hypothetical protein [Chiloscyllium punctatum]